MDPDSEAVQTASQILRTSVITVVFTTCHYYKTETTVSSAKLVLPLKVTVHETVKKPAVKKKAKTIYLTFDDGPNKGTKK
jgi:peptidoglycan/xylan/chitin deacetylase (PgdA/CDA1 family)